MATLELGDAEIHYEVTGDGFPVLLFAPGFLSSRIERWQTNPDRPEVAQDWRDPVPVLAPHFRVVALDVRNAGRSRGEIGPGYSWATYAADHLRLLQHLGIERCHVMGACIGVSFALSLEERAPGTVVSLVLQNPIGLSATNRAVVDRAVDNWKKEMSGRPDVERELLDAVGPRMFGGDFIFSVSRSFVAAVGVPTLLMPGNDAMHATSISQELATLTGAEVIDPWKGPDHRDGAIERTRDFLIAHTPRL